MQLTHTTGHHTVRTAIAAACLAALALLAILAPAANAANLTTAQITLKDRSGHVIRHADCLTDTAANRTSLCQFLTARGTHKTGRQVFQWVADARAAGAATAAFTESGDSFTGTSTYTIPPNDTTPYRETTVGVFPPERKTTTLVTEIESVNAMIASYDCLTATPRKACHFPSRPVPSVLAAHPATKHHKHAAHQTKKHRHHHQ